MRSDEMIRMKDSGIDYYHHSTLSPSDTLESARNDKGNQPRMHHTNAPNSSTTTESYAQNA